VASEHWKDDPEAEDFPAAESYLSLLVGEEAAAKLAKALRKERSLKHYAGEGPPSGCGPATARVQRLRGSRRFQEVKQGDKLSPVLLVQGVPLWVADGYHRICASYHLDEKTQVPCRVVARTH